MTTVFKNKFFHLTGFPNYETEIASFKVVSNKAKVGVGGEEKGGGGGGQCGCEWHRAPPRDLPLKLCHNFVLDISCLIPFNVVLCRKRTCKPGLSFVMVPLWQKSLAKFFFNYREIEAPRK